VMTVQQVMRDHERSAGEVDLRSQQVMGDQERSASLADIVGSCFLSPEAQMSLRSSLR
jgi:hypothetical protein